MSRSESRWIEKMSKMAVESSQVDSSLYKKYDVKRGLRDINGKGVLAGLTQIGEVQAHPEGDPTGPGHLIYRGIDIETIVSGFMSERRHGYEETCYLLLTGRLPNASEMTEFKARLGEYRELPHSFIHESLLTLSSKDVMNAMAQTILSLYVLDDRPDDTSISNVFRQSLRLIAAFPMLAVYSYRAAAYHYGGRSLVIRSPRPDLSTAQNFLHMLRRDKTYTPLEAQLLDLALVLHAEHGGGNNSSFTTHVVTSSGTDTYSAIAAAMGSLKGPKHGGANAKVVQMFSDMKKNVKDWSNEKQIEDYLAQLLRKKAFDRTGLVYGIGHAVYSMSDPRTEILRSQVERLAAEKGVSDEMDLYKRVERLAPAMIAGERKMYKGVSANVDFYSGFLYRLLDIPQKLFTPIFAIARIAGWSAHRLEELANGGKIIRPAYKSVADTRPYIPLQDR